MNKPTLTIPEDHIDLVFLKDATATQDSLLRSYENPTAAGNYLTANAVKQWTPVLEQLLKDQIEFLNTLTKEYTFEIVSFSDYEVDDDRTYDASFAFFARKTK